MTPRSSTYIYMCVYVYIRHIFDNGIITVPPSDESTIKNKLPRAFLGLSIGGKKLCFIKNQTFPFEDF